jgi:branched-chain amino acid transport system substrate-binding protein
MQTSLVRANRFWVAASLFALTIGGAACKKSQQPDAAGGGGAASTSTDTIKVGEVGSMTGSEATFGVSTHQGIEMAFKEVNAAGGVKGKKLEHVTLDDQGKPEEAAQAVTKLITQNGVSAILGEVASGRSLAMAPIAQQNGVPMITPSSVNPKVTEAGDYVFRVCYVDHFQSRVMSKFAKDTLKAKKAAILRDVKNDYSVGLANSFIEEFKKQGGEIVIDQSYSAGDIDFKSQLTSIRAKAPDVIFIPGYSTEAGLIARQAKELGIQAPLLGGDGWDSPKLVEIGGAALDGAYFSTHFSADDPSQAVQGFLSRYKAQYGATPDAIAALGYDAAKVLADAMSRAKSLSRPDIRDAIAQTKGYQAVTGKITLDEKRNASKSVVVIHVDGGKQKLAATVNP